MSFNSWIQLFPLLLPILVSFSSMLSFILYLNTPMLFYFLYPVFLTFS